MLESAGLPGLPVKRLRTDGFRLYVARVANVSYVVLAISTIAKVLRIFQTHARSEAMRKTSGDSHARLHACKLHLRFSGSIVVIGDLTALGSLPCLCQKVRRAP